MRLIDADALKEAEPNYSEDGYRVFYEYEINNAPTVVSEITEKQAILLLINNGWLVNHDKELREKWERPQGKWKNTRPPEMSDNIVCSVCGYDSIASFDFCPNCGADMRGGEES